MFAFLLITACLLLSIYLKWNFTYWKRHRFPFIEPKVPFGVLDSVRRRERSFGMAIYDAYKNSTEKVVGIYLLFRPALLVRDAQIARDMLTTEFTSFHDRGIFVDEKHDPMSGHLFALQGKNWKTLRTKLTPSFTSGKMKGMFDTVEDISNKMLNHLNEIVPDQGSAEVNLKEIFAAYAIDIIGSVIFGLEVNSFKEPHNIFKDISSKINRPSFIDVLRATCKFLYPGLEKIFARLRWYEEAPELMRQVVHDTIQMREERDITRRDMLQLLLQLRNTGKISANDDIWSAESKSDVLKSMSVDAIAAQLFLFYVAGYETTASAAAFTIYELAQNPEVLKKAQKDVEDVLRRHGKLSYEAIQDMKYLDLCVMETIRIYPGLPILNRECTADYSIPGTKHVIKKGTPIVISLFGIQRDPQYFPNPLSYEPERFLEENKNYNPSAYMPFGEGPRHCIAQRMGKVNVKVAVAQLLMNFNIEAQERREIEFESHGLPILAKGGIKVRLSKKCKDEVFTTA